MRADASKTDIPNPDVPKHHQLRPFQFDIRALLILTALLSVLLAVLRLLDLSPGAMLLILGITAFSTLAAAGLVVALSVTLGRSRGRKD